MVTHITKLDNWTTGRRHTFCGEVVRKRTMQTKEGERILDYVDWLGDCEETCVTCEASLECRGLPNRG